MNANVMFSFTQLGSEQDFVELDPRMGRLIIFEQDIQVDEDYNLTKEQVQFEVLPFIPENFPEYFDAGIVPDWMTLWGAPPLSTKAFQTNARVINRYDEPPFTSVVASIRECIPEDLPDGVQCASYEEAEAYFNNVQVMITYFHNFVNFDLVKDDPIEKSLQIFQTFNVKPNVDDVKFISLMETRVSLMDHLWQLFVEPKEFSFVNLKETFQRVRVQNVIDLWQPGELRSYVTFNFSIDTEVLISKRIVKDFIFLFGEVGGFQSIIITLLTLVIARFQAKAYYSSLSQKLFSQDTPLRRLDFGKSREHRNDPYDKES